MSTNGEQAARPTADVSAQRVAKVYAEALLNAAEARGQADEIQEEYDSLIGDVFEADPELEAFLSSLAVGRKHKAEVLQSVFEQRASETFFNFLMVLNRHERLELLRPILKAYRALRDQRARRIRVQVKSAVPLPDDQRDHLLRLLRETFQLEPVLETAVDPDLLGGLVVRVGDWLFDGSVQCRIDNIRSELLERTSHEIQTRRDQFSNIAGNQ